MHLRSIPTLKLLLALVPALLAWPVAAEEDAVMSVEAIGGLVQVQRGGHQYSLREDDALLVGDIVLTDERGRATLSLGRHGFVELGGNAQLTLEALPPSSYSTDLKTVFNLTKGYLRVVWKRPQSSTAWPIFVVQGAARSMLGSGEYFFQQMAEPRFCTAAGVLVVQATGAAETLRPPACALLKADSSLAIGTRRPDDWIAVRLAYSLRAGEPVVTEVAAVAAPTPEPVAAASAAVATAAAAPETTLASDMPAAKPGQDYSLLQDIAQPAITTSTASVAAPAAPVAAAAPTVPVEVPAAPENRFEVAITPRTEPAAPTPPLPELSKPTAKPSTAARAMVKGTWRINVASSTDPAEARALLAEIQAKGLAARALEVDIRGRPWTRLQVGAYASNDAAKADAARVQKLLGLSSVWFAQDK